MNMKHKILIISLFFINYLAMAQTKEGMLKPPPYNQSIATYGIQVTFYKTVHIIFPTGIKYVDLGSDDLIAGKAEGADNVLRIKSAVEGFPGETNFSVITEDGSFYSFNASYAKEPELLNVEMKDYIENGYSQTRMNIYLKELGNESPALVKMIMRSIYTGNEKRLRHLGSNKFNMQALIKGIYVYNELFYFHVQLTNKSNVPYDIDYVKFKIIDKKSAKRTATQETVIYPIRSYNEQLKIEGNATVRTVFVLKKITFSDDKVMLVEWYEKEGGRHQSIRVESQDINDAYPVSEIKIK